MSISWVVSEAEANQIEVDVYLEVFAGVSITWGANFCARPDLISSLSGATNGVRRMGALDRTSDTKGGSTSPRDTTTTTTTTSKGHLSHGTAARGAKGAWDPQHDISPSFTTSFPQQALQTTPVLYRKGNSFNWPK